MSLLSPGARNPGGRRRRRRCEGRDGVRRQRQLDDDPRPAARFIRPERFSGGGGGGNRGEWVEENVERAAHTGKMAGG